MKIYTKSGDKGTTSLVGGARVSKSSVRLEAYGTLDELSAHIGILHATPASSPAIKQELEWIISRVMDCSAILASEDTTIAKLPQITTEHSLKLESWIDAHLDGLPQLKYFTLPLGASGGAQAHVARTVCRRAERRMIAVVEAGLEVPQEVNTFINRLSDYLYALSRAMVAASGEEEICWIP